jgi:hypothetical protein
MPPSVQHRYSPAVNRPGHDFEEEERHMLAAVVRCGAQRCPFSDIVHK